MKLEMKNSISQNKQANKNKATKPQWKVSQTESGSVLPHELIHCKSLLKVSVRHPSFLPHVMLSVMFSERQTLRHTHTLIHADADMGISPGLHSSRHRYGHTQATDKGLLVTWGAKWRTQIWAVS